MITVDDKEFKMLCRLARLDFEACGGMREEFGEFIEFCNAVNSIEYGEADVEGNACTALEDLRGDEPCESLPPEKVLSNVRAERGCFAVRRALK